MNIVAARIKEIMMKKLLILLCVLVSAAAGNVHAAASIGGAYEGKVYRNAWMGLSFTPTDKLSQMPLSDKITTLYKTDADTLSKLAARDFDEAVAFFYIMEGFGGSVTLSVINPEREQKKLGKVESFDDYLAKVTALDKELPGQPEVSAPFDAVLAGRPYKAWNRASSNGQGGRTYVREQDGLLVVIAMATTAMTDDAGKLLSQFESCFGPYEGSAIATAPAPAPAPIPAKPPKEVGEYFNGGYRNAWLELNFNAPGGENVTGRFFNSKERPQDYWFSDTGERLERIVVDGDVSEVRAFAYNLTSPRTSAVDVRVINMGKRIDNAEWVKNTSEYIAYKQRTGPESMGGKIDYSATKSVVLGGKQFMTYEYKSPFGTCVRVYVRQVDNWLLVVEMSAFAKDFKETREVFTLFENGFSKY